MRRLSLQWKFGLLVLSGLVVLFGLFAFLGSRLADDSARGLENGRLNTARMTAVLLDQAFEEQFEELEWDASRLGAGDPFAEPARSDLLRPNEPFITGLRFVDANGIVRWSVPTDDRTGSNISEAPWVSAPLASGQRYASGVMAGPPGARGPQPRVMFSVPVRDTRGAIQGVLVARLDPSDALFQVMVTAAQQLGPSGHAELVDQDLRLVASNEPGHALGPAEHPSFYGPLLSQHTSNVGLTDPIGAEDPADEGQRHVMAFVPLNTVPWGIGLGGTEAVFTTGVDRWRLEALGLGFLGLLIALFLVWVTRREVVRPLRLITHHLSAGDITRPLPAVGDGEVRVLAETLEDMRRRLQQAQQSEEHLSQLKDEFLATASHELRSPVAALSMLVQLQLSRLRRGTQVDHQAALQEIKSHTERLEGLVTRLLDTSRIEAGKLELERLPTDLTRLAEDIVRLAQVTARDQQLSVHASGPVGANVDRLRMGEVLNNLLDNAVKFSPVGGSIEVEVGTTPDGRARLAVRDHGPGISPEERARVFDRFYQARGRWSLGLGLGLYICHQIVELHGGSIEVEGPEDGGTRFVVTLPGLSAEQSAPADVEKSAAA
jgi:two-component system, OmpR family, sensor kinase